MGTVKSSALKVLIRSSMFLAYLFAGSGIFLLLEKSTQEEKRSTASRDLLEYEEQLKLNRNVTDNEIYRFKELVEKALNVGATGKKKLLTEWNFANAFFFCGNVITTIGYGHITPQTIGGRIVMMVYALFGISLTGFFLRTVGNELTTVIAFLIKTYERRVQNREAERLEIKCAVVSLVLVLFMLLFGGVMFMEVERTWNFIDAFYFSFVSLTTIGFGDMIPGNAREDLNNAEEIFLELAFLIYYVLGLSIMSGVIVALSGVIEEKTKKLDITDPMDAIRNLRIENLNSKAMKKLGYKVDEGPLPPKMMKGMSSVNTQRRGTIIPDDDERIAISRSRASLQQHQLHNGGANKKPSPSPSQRSSVTNQDNKAFEKGEEEFAMTEKIETKSPSSNHRDHTTTIPSPALKARRENSLQSLIEADENEKENTDTGRGLNNNSNNNNSNNEHFADPRLEQAAQRSKTYTFNNEKLFTLNENGISDNNNTATTTPTSSADTQRTNSLSNVKIGVQRKSPKERVVPKDKLRKHSSLKDLNINYSSNIHSMQRERKCHSETKRVGLPAELFANDVSFTVKKSARENACSPPSNRLKLPKSAGDINGSFYTIPPASPVCAYNNNNGSFFQNDDVIYSALVSTTTTGSLDLNHVTNNNSNLKKRPNTSERLKQV